MLNSLPMLQQMLGTLPQGGRAFEVRDKPRPLHWQPRHRSSSFLFLERATHSVNMGNVHLTTVASTSISIQPAKKYRSRRLRRSRNRRRRNARELPLLVEGRVDHPARRRSSGEKRYLASSMVPMPDARKATAVSSRIDKYASSTAMPVIQHNLTLLR